MGRRLSQSRQGTPSPHSVCLHVRRGLYEGAFTDASLRVRACVCQNNTRCPDARVCLGARGPRSGVEPSISIEQRASSNRTAGLNTHLSACSHVSATHTHRRLGCVRLIYGTSEPTKYSSITPAFIFLRAKQLWVSICYS